jgi:hypothetical protein
MPDPADLTSEDAAFAAAVAGEAQTQALSLDNPAKIAENVKDWIAENFPDEVATAYWVTISAHHDRDKGIAIEVAKLPYDLHAKVLMGEWSGGVGIFTRDFDASQFHAKWSIGAGIAAPYANLEALRPFIGVTVRFGGS